MPGIRPAVVIGTAVLALIAAPATADPPQHTLPTGTAVVFVAEVALDATPREGTVVPVHLRDPLSLDGTVVAPAGSKAKLRVFYPFEKPGSRGAPVVRLEEFTIPAGLMPVHADHPIALPIAVGDTIAAATQAEIQHIGQRFSILLPFPFPLSSEKPFPYYTATPAKTAPPHSLPPPRHGHGPPTPLPTASAAPDASAAPAPAPLAPGESPSPTPSPSPAMTALPASSGGALFGPSGTPESASPSPTPSPTPSPR
jgi:hypothetical protein